MKEHHYNSKLNTTIKLVETKNSGVRQWVKTSTDRLALLKPAGDLALFFYAPLLSSFKNYFMLEAQYATKILQAI